MPFDVFSKDYEHQTFIRTSTVEFDRWNAIFGDDRLTAAMMDRIVHRSHILSFAVPSRRLEEAMAMHRDDNALTNDESSPRTTKVAALGFGKLTFNAVIMKTAVTSHGAPNPPTALCY